MLRYIVRRLVYMLITLWLIVTFTFVLMKFLPGDPFGEDSQKLTIEQRAALAKQYGLDKPIWEQYLQYVGNVAKGDLGVSNSRPAK